MNYNKLNQLKRQSDNKLDLSFLKIPKPTDKSVFNIKVYYGAQGWIFKYEQPYLEEFLKQ